MLSCPKIAVTRARRFLRLARNLTLRVPYHRLGRLNSSAKRQLNRSCVNLMMRAKKRWRKEVAFHLQPVAGKISCPFCLMLAIIELFLLCSCACLLRLWASGHLLLLLAMWASSLLMEVGEQKIGWSTRLALCAMHSNRVIERQRILFNSRPLYSVIIDRFKIIASNGKGSHFPRTCTCNMTVASWLRFRYLSYTLPSGYFLVPC